MMNKWISWFLILSSVIILRAQQQVDSLVTKTDIQHTEILLDIQLTESERDSLLDGVNGYLKSYRNLHKFDLANHIPPVLTFNPIPINLKLDTQQYPIVWSNYSSTKMPERMDDLSWFTIGELAELIRKKELTSTKLTQFCLNRLKKYGPTLECVITLTDSLALAQARKADSEIAAGKYRGVLHGIPYGIKDLFTKKGYKTTWGAMPYKDQVLDEDATVVKKLEEAGAVLVAKLTLGALAWGDRWYGGLTKNPWDITQGSSGSSAGSASAVSAGLIPFAIGTETWGSIVSPSTVCGVTGLRPTFGRVSRHGAMALSWSMDKVGPICRTVEDCSMVFNAIHGPDGLDQSVVDAAFNYNPEIKWENVRIGYLKKDFEREYSFHKNDSLVLKKLEELGAQLIPIKPPDLPIGDLSFILTAEAAAAFDALTRTNQDSLMVRQIKNAWPNVFREARFIPAVEYINANRMRHLLVQEMQKTMEDIDVYLAPSWTGNNLLMTNLTGHPCVVLPTGFENGTPTSITFNGRLFDEGTLLTVAKKYQDATGHHERHPNLD